MIACDMANTPLEAESVHCVVFCLSLMGTNLHDFINEANRVLKAEGILKIAEVRSRFTDANIFIGDIERCGFSLMNKDLNNKLFYFLNFKKVAKQEQTKSTKNGHEFRLNPCLYKKR